MGTGSALLVFVSALVVGVQVLMPMSRNRPMAKRLRDLSSGGDAWSFLIGGGLIVAAAGAVIGSLFSEAAGGASIAAVIALISWHGAVIWAHRQDRPGPKQRDS